jgi:hypothetical protein
MEVALVESLLAEITDTAEREAYALRVLRIINGEAFDGRLDVGPHLCERVYPGASALGVCIICGRFA